VGDHREEQHGRDEGELLGEIHRGSWGEEQNANHARRLAGNANASKSELESSQWAHRSQK
jgi:hypothetical protein